MPWFPVDDRFHSHPKAGAASLAAIGLWALAGSWAQDHLTDGDIPEHMIRSLSRGAIELADELVSVGLWRRTKAGYRFHQWHERNATRSEVTAAREKKSSGGVLGNHRRWHASPGGKPDPKCPYCGDDQEVRRSKKDRSTDRSTDRSSEGGSDRTPNPPIPSHTTESSTNSLTSDEPDGFDEFWAAYPPRRNSSKADARKAYAAAIKKGAKPDEILAGAKLYADSRAGQDQQYTAHAATWLHGKRWEDLLATPVAAPKRKFAWEN